ncbi:serine hydrolase domain-containing protein [Maribacter sp. HTCC2170]|uniref:serine hydrolase domain-containing protein n=1 Tax=Maribacter sp. (strain HTCC2170 / KCCM 42371) TaxID=313603 RepID=UPI00006B21A9|nr:serine hydrolase domain-containing protein [Maribacter sp. HTCC2170]EAR00157.1 Beta-lactamase [Maribacter sp. HTCC2170]
MTKNHLKTLTTLVLLYLFIPFSSNAQNSGGNKTIEGLSKERIARYDSFLKNEIDEGRIAGAVSLISRNGKIVHKESFGLQSKTAGSQMNDDGIFHLMSMTKPIVTAAFMMLYEEGHFFLTDPVSKYLPQFKDMEVSSDSSKGKDGPTESAHKEITIAHLLSHTAGFSHGLGGTELDNDIAKALYYEPQENIESRVNTLASLPLVGHPGEQWYYSASPDVLALMIEKISGQSLDKFLDERIFKPLGMNDTGYNISKKNHARWVPVHNINKEGTLVNSEQQLPIEGNAVFGGTHGLFSTASDYLRFCQMMLNKGNYNGQQFLSSKTVDIMTLNQTGDLQHAPGQGFGFGFGVTVDLADSKSLGSVGQYYWGGAYSTYFFIDPNEKLISILMTQLQPYSNYYSEKMRQFVYQTIVD